MNNVTSPYGTTVPPEVLQHADVTSDTSTNNIIGVLNFPFDFRRFSFSFFDSLAWSTFSQSQTCKFETPTQPLFSVSFFIQARTLLAPATTATATAVFALRDQNFAHDTRNHGGSPSGLQGLEEEEEVPQ